MAELISTPEAPKVAAVELVSDPVIDPTDRRARVKAWLKRQHDRAYPIAVSLGSKLWGFVKGVFKTIGDSYHPTETPKGVIVSQDLLRSFTGATFDTSLVAVFWTFMLWIVQGSIWFVSASPNPFIAIPLLFVLNLIRQLVMRLKGGPDPFAAVAPAPLAEIPQSSSLKVVQEFPPDAPAPSAWQLYNR